MKILIAFGTRPEAIKMAPLIHMLSNNDNIELLVCVTGQHRHMLDQVLSIFDIKPDIDLDIMSPGQSLSGITSIILSRMSDVLSQHTPDLVLVHGDTTTAFATALAAFYLNVKIGHVEAGLRTYNLNAPFPEEFNRQIVSKIAHLHFAPTDTSKNNLIKEGVNQSKIEVTGNTVIDSMYFILNKLETDKVKKSEITSSIIKNLGFDFINEKYVLITGHRRENFGEGFLEICKAIKELAVKFLNIRFVYPVHLNPLVQKPVFEILGDQSNVHLIQPQEYESFLTLLKNSYIVLTDSGGVQEEAPSLGKPVLVMRDVTERPEAVEAGTVKLVGSNSNKIVANVSDLLMNQFTYNSMSTAHNPYGDGESCRRIVTKILSSNF